MRWKLTRGDIYQAPLSREFPFAATCSEKEQTRKISFLQEQITEYMVLEIQLWSVNFTHVARVCKSNANDKAKQYMLGFKVNKTF